MLKDILLVVASMVLFLDPVSPLQAFGYSIALGGLCYYKLGADKMKMYFAEGQRSWSDYGVRHPALRKMIIIGSALLTAFLLLGGLAPTLAPGYDAYAKKQVAEQGSKIAAMFSDKTV